MAVRNAKLGGTNLTDEAGKPSDWNDTFDAVQFESKAVNTTPVTVSSSSGTSTGSFTLSVPINVINKYIIILFDITGSATSVSGVSGDTGSYSSNIQGLLKKTVLTVDTTLIANRTFCSASSGGGGSGYLDHNNNNVNFTLHYYYEPTASEKSGGFDITLDMTAVGAGTSGSFATGSITVQLGRVMGM